MKHAGLGFENTETSSNVGFFDPSFFCFFGQTEIPNYFCYFILKNVPPRSSSLFGVAATVGAECTRTLHSGSVGSAAQRIREYNSVGFTEASQ